MMEKLLLPRRRLGIHYPHEDNEHFRQSDLYTLLPKMREIGACWIVLDTPREVFIPEPFIVNLIDEGIQPILHLKSKVGVTTDLAKNPSLFETYAKWGVKYITIFDRPNSRNSWEASSWVQIELVERFLDIYIPLHLLAMEAGLNPIFPPLEPGGDYWDTAFLRDALQGIQNRGVTKVLDDIVLSAYASVFPLSRPLSWGAGGPERWPGSRPYFTPTDQQDQLGFYIFEWYLTIAEAITAKIHPFFLFGVGSCDPEPTQFPSIDDEEEYERRMAAITQLLEHESKEKNSTLETVCGVLPVISTSVIACIFSHLPPIMAGESQDSDGVLSTLEGANFSKSNSKADTDSKAQASQGDIHPIDHYLLLPLYEWGAADWHLEVIRPFVLKHHPTVGFSIEEARYAQRVTIVGGTNVFSDLDLERLQRAGCQVERISGDGTSIATQLATR